MAAEGEGGVPVDGGGRVGGHVGVRVGDDVRRREDGTGGEGGPGGERQGLGARLVQPHPARRVRQSHGHSEISGTSRRRPSAEDFRPSSASWTPRAAGQEVPAVGRVGVDVPQEQLPLRFESVVELGVVGDLLPLVAEGVGGRDVGVPDRLGGGGPVLDTAVAQPGDSRALRPVDLELDQFVTVDTHGPGGVDLGDGTALQLEDAVRGVVGRGVVRLALLVPPLRDVGGGECLDGGDPAEELVQDVLPVREHVDDDAAAVLGAVVPGGTLGGLPVALEDPVAELAPHGQDPPEEAAVDQALELQQPREEELVLHDPVLDALRVGEPGQFQGAVETGGGRLLGVDVLPRRDGLPDGLLAGGGDLRVEVEVDIRVGEDRVQVRRPVLQPVPLGERPQGVLAAADEDRLGPQRRTVAQIQTALVAQGEDRADEVLAVAHASRHAVHGDTHRLACHVFPFVRGFRAAYAPLTSVTASAFYPREKLASVQPIGQDHAGDEMFDRPDVWT